MRSLKFLVRGMIIEAIIAEVNEAKFFAVISDEVQDAASIEQITFVQRKGILML